MSQANTSSRSVRPPAFDPREVPIEPTAEQLPAVPLERLHPQALRTRFAEPPRWEPELFGDRLRMRTGEPRPAAVLVPIVLRDSEPHVLLTERTAHLHDHAGQVAFPGGRTDDEDASPVHTALREAQEEIGLAPELVEVIGSMPEYLTGTGYRVTPVVALVQPTLEIKLDAFEVAEAFEVPMGFLMNPRHHQLRRMRIDTGERLFYAMPWRPAEREREFFIWGATAAMLRNLYRFLSA